MSVNPKKTMIVCFKRRRRTNEVVRLEYQGVKLILTKEVKYEGCPESNKTVVRKEIKKVESGNHAYARVI